MEKTKDSTIFILKKNEIPIDWKECTKVLLVSDCEFQKEITDDDWLFSLLNQVPECVKEVTLRNFTLWKVRYVMLHLEFLKLECFRFDKTSIRIDGSMITSNEFRIRGKYIKEFIGPKAKQDHTVHMCAIKYAPQNYVPPLMLDHF